jgi:hypothetical protein
MNRFRFPISSGERIVLLAAGLVGVGLLPLVGLLIARAPMAQEMSFWTFLQAFPDVRMPLGLAVALLLASAAMALAWTAQKAGTELSWDEQTFRYTRPAWAGIPGTGRQVECPLNLVSAPRVQIRLRGLSRVWCVEVDAGPHVIVMNLNHARPASGGPQTACRTSEQALQHPLVLALATATGRSARAA